MRFISRWLVIVVCVFGVLGGTVAFAGPFARPTKQEARDHLDRGNRLYNTRSFDEAIIEFKAGALVEPVPVFDYNLGQAYRQVGKYQEAIWHYDRFLQHGRPTGEVLDAVTGFMAEMRAQLANRAPAMPPTTPAANTDGSPSEAVGGAPAPRAPRSSTEPDRGHAGQDGSITTNDHDGGASHYWFGWTMTGAGVVAIGSAGYLFLRASSLHDQAGSELNSRTRNDLYDQAKTRNLLGAVIGIGGVVLTATGVVLLAAHSPDRGHPHTASVDIGISGRGMIVFGQF